MSLGDFLKHIRIKHGLNQSQFGDIILRNKDYVYLLENDKTKPSVKELQMIGEKLDEPLLKYIMYGITISQVLEIK